MGFESDRPPEKMVGSGPQTRPLVPTGPREGNTIQGKPDVFGTKCPLKVGLRLRALSECPCLLHITQCTYHVQTLPCCQLPSILPAERQCKDGQDAEVHKKDDKYWKGRTVGDHRLREIPPKGRKIPEASQCKPISAAGLRSFVSPGPMEISWMAR